MLLRSPDDTPTAPQAEHANRTDAIPFSFRYALILFLAFLAATLAVHAPGLDAPMLYDSRGYIVEKEPLFLKGSLSETIRIIPARPLFMATLHLNYLLTGMDPFSFRVINGAVLAGTGVILVVLLALILGIPGLNAPGTPKQRLGVSVFLGFFFVVHPLQTFVVLYVIQREAILACFFYFAGLALYVGLRSGRVGNERAGYVWCGLLFGAGLLCKENVITLPVAMLLAEVTLFRQGVRQALRRACVIALVTVPPFLGYLALTDFFYASDSMHPRGVLSRLVDHYEISGLSPIAVFLTECRVLFIYLGTVFAPFAVGPQLVRAMTVSPSLSDSPDAVVALAGVIGLIAAGLGLMRRQPLVSFGLLFFFIAIGPESLLIPQYLFFGYRPILPMAGLLAIVGYGLLFGIEDLRGKLSRLFRPAVVLLATGIVALFASITYRQAMRWDPLLFWSETFANLPPVSSRMETQPYLNTITGYGGELISAGRFQEVLTISKTALAIGSMVLTSKPRKTEGAVDSAGAPELGQDFSPIYIQMGISHMKLGEFREARECFLRAIELKPDLPGPHYDLGVLETKQDRPAEAVTHFRKAIEFDPSHAEAYNGLGEALIRIGRSGDALQMLRKAIELKPSFADPYNNLGNLLLGQGRAAEAIEHYRTGIRLKPGSAQPYNNLGAALLALNRADEARDCFARAVSLEPMSSRYHLNLGTALIRLGRIGEGIEHQKRATEIDPTFGPAFSRLGRAYEQSGQLQAAEAPYRRVTEINPDSSEAHCDLAELLVKLNRIPEAMPHYEKAVELKTDNARAHAGIGAVLFAGEAYEQSIEHLRKALSISPKLPEAKEQLEFAIRRLRERNEPR